MKNFPATIKVSPKVISETLEGEEVLLNLQTKIYFGLNESGTQIWEMLRKRRDPEAILKTLTETYDIPPQTARHDLLTLLRELKQHHLIETV